MKNIKAVSTNESLARPVTRSPSSRLDMPCVAEEELKPEEFRVSREIQGSISDVQKARAISAIHKRSNMYIYTIKHGWMAFL
jgi:hypothetical protein